MRTHSIHKSQCPVGVITQLVEHYVYDNETRKIHHVFKLQIETKFEVWKFGFTKRVDKGRITTVKDLKNWRFER